MFIANPMPEQIGADIIELLEKVEVATIGHVLHSGFVDPEIRAVLPGKRVAGTAVTLRIPNADSTMLHYLSQFVRPGDIVLIDRCGDTRHACWGGVITNTMKMAGVKAGVVDGPATDFSEFAMKAVLSLFIQARLEPWLNAPSACRKPNSCFCSACATVRNCRTFLAPTSSFRPS